MDVLRPVVELINFNLNIIKNLWIPCIFYEKKKTTQKSAVAVLLIPCCGVVLNSVKSLVGWVCNADVVSDGYTKSDTC